VFQASFPADENSFRQPHIQIKIFDYRMKPFGRQFDSITNLTA